MDIRRALLGFMHHSMPKASRWERRDIAKALAYQAAATPGLYVNFTALHAHVTDAMNAKLGTVDRTAWSMEAVREQCSVAVTNPKIMW